MNDPGPGYGEMIDCPYCKKSIRKARIQRHLVKCAINFPGSKLQKCQYDSTHRFLPEEKAAHLETCPARILHEQASATVQNAKENPIEIELPSPSEPSGNDAEESWDDLEFQTYDPQKYAENAPVLRQLNVAPKSELKKFRDNERRRGANFEQQARKN